MRQIKDMRRRVTIYRGFDFSWNRRESTLHIPSTVNLRASTGEHKYPCRAIEHHSVGTLCKFRSSHIDDSPPTALICKVRLPSSVLLHCWPRCLGLLERKTDLGHRHERHCLTKEGVQCSLSLPRSLWYQCWCIRAQRVRFVDRGISMRGCATSQRFRYDDVSVVHRQHGCVQVNHFRREAPSDLHTIPAGSRILAFHCHSETVLP